MAARRSRFLATVAVIGLTALALAGCAQTSVDATPPDISHLIVGANGIDGLQIGHPITDHDLVNYGPHACPSHGGWLPRYPQDATNSSGQQLDPFDVDTKSAKRSGAITDEFVWSKSIATSKGIRVGSTLAEVKAAYPAATTTKAYSTVVYAVPGSAGKLLIEVAGHNDDAAGSGRPRRSERWSGCT